GGEGAGPRRAPQQRAHPWLLHRLGPRPRRREVHELPLERRHVVAPQRLHAQHVLAQAGAAAGEIDAVVLYLLAVPAHADAQVDTATRAMVQPGDGPGHRDGVVLKRERHTGAEADATAR